MSEDGRTKDKQTLIEAGTTFKGSFASDCPIIVRGRIEGEVSGPSLTVSATGAVSGIVKVGKLCSDGELSGEYDADEVQLSGVVKDQTVIRARSLEVRLAPERGRMQVVFGECDLQVGDVPTMEESVAAARAPASVPAAAPPPAPVPAPKTDDGEEAGSNLPTNPPPALTLPEPGLTEPEPAMAEQGGKRRRREGRSSTIPPSSQ